MASITVTMASSISKGFTVTLNELKTAGSQKESVAGIEPMTLPSRTYRASL